MKWLTDNSELKQLKSKGKWLVKDNELFKDEDGTIYLVPRNYISDNYTIPNWIAWLAGSKSEYDVRPAHLHDFGCQYHQLIKVLLNEFQLRQLRLLHVKNNEIICEDIPTKFLSLVPITKWEMDCIFKRAMKGTKSIPSRAYCTYRIGVFFNFGWMGKHPSYDLNNIYKEVLND